MDQPTLSELSPRLALAMLPHVPFDGWTRQALRKAAADLGIDWDVAAIVFPAGAPDMVAAYVRAADRRMLDTCDTAEFRTLKVRDKVKGAIRTRLEEAAPHREAVRRAAAVLALPGNLPLALRLTWGTADAIWRAAGDTATDFNHYTKRTLASAVYSATLFHWLGDESEGFADTWAFLDRRIDDVMRLGRLTGRLRRAAPEDGFDLIRFLGRLRYPPERA